ncbi:hypothetical protein AB0M45_22140 [Nocardia sp. NPDC051787]|uniref:hypothetical protein n=1 Tax=Nocardia sp. NPDC051787 TaxID=3155415 RepID=UPI003446136B
MIPATTAGLVIRLTPPVEDVAAALRKQLTGLGNELRMAVPRFKHLDADSAKTFRDLRIEGFTPSLRRRIEFHPSQVESVALIDMDGRPAGVTFPTVERDREWPELSGEYLSADETLRLWNPGAEIGSLMTAPWAADTMRGAKPVFAVAHGGKSRIYVTVRDGDGGKYQVALDGAEYGRMLLANQHLAAATGKAGRSGPLVLVSCQAADGSVARRAVEVLQPELKRDIYASRTYFDLIYDGENALTVDQLPDGSSPLVKYEYPATGKSPRAGPSP